MSTKRRDIKKLTSRGARCRAFDSKSGAHSSKGWWVEKGTSARKLLIRVKLFRKFVKVSHRSGSVVSAGPAATRARHRSISLVFIVDSSWAGFTGLLSQETLTTSVKDVSIVTNEDIVNHENRRGNVRFHRGEERANRGTEECVFTPRACIIHISAVSPAHRHFESPLLRFIRSTQHDSPPHSDFTRLKEIQLQSEGGRG